MLIEGVNTRRVHSIPNQDPTLGALSREQQEQQGQKQPGAKGTGGGSSFSDTVSLSPEAQSELSKLQQRDREVRSHESAHIAAGGPHVQGGASYTYTKGPDNKQYATGGSVSIDTSPVPDDPEATKEKARMVRSAALAPGTPSAQDQSVAAQAASMEAQAQSDEKTQENNPDPSKQKPGEINDNKNDKKDNTAVPEALTALGQNHALQEPQAVQPPQRTQATRQASSLGAVSGEDTHTSPAHGNTGLLLGAMEFQARGDKVAAAYQAQQNKFIPVRDVAPWGTGIELQV